MQKRDKAVYRHGRFTLFDSKNEDCIEFGKDNAEGELRNGEICVSTVIPNTKVGNFDGNKKIEVTIENIPPARVEKSPFLENSYLGTHFMIFNSVLFSIVIVHLLTELSQSWVITLCRFSIHHTSSI